MIGLGLGLKRFAIYRSLKKQSTISTDLGVVFRPEEEVPTAESPFKLRRLILVFGLVDGRSLSPHWHIGTAKKVAEPLTPSGGADA